jgi:hypothetical protein
METPELSKAQALPQKSLDTEYTQGEYSLSNCPKRKIHLEQTS